MKSFLNRLGFTLSAMLCANTLGLASKADVPEPSLTRLPEAPAWERVLTDRLQWLPFDTTDAMAAAAAPGKPYAEFLDRARRAADLRSTGQTDWWRLPVALTGTVRSLSWPLVLEVDEHRTIESVWIDTQTAPAWMWGMERASVGGYAAIMLPLTPQRPSSTVIIKARTLTGLNPVGFGQVRLRTARVDEVFELKDDGHRIEVKNRGPFQQKATIAIRHEDYFKTELAWNEVTVNLASGASEKVPAEAPKGTYKTRAWVVAGERTGSDHWRIADPERDNRVRDEVLRLSDGWECAWSDKPIAGALPPSTGWKPAKMPFHFEKEIPSHWVWLRRSIVVPSDWKGTRAQLSLIRALSHVAVFVDGERVAERGVWELPDTVDLPASVRPGTRCTLVLGVTDFSVALAPGIPDPGPNATDLPMRARVGPIADLGIGIPSAPELLGVPEVRTDWVAITPAIVGGKSLFVKAEIKNSGGSKGTVVARCEVLERGKPVLKLPEAAVVIDSGSLQTTTFTVPWPGAKLWMPETPVLYELRVTLATRDGRVLDVRRERFGFRTFEARDGRFTLNGRTINLYGGSHQVLQNLLWPVVYHPFRMIRYYGNMGSLSLFGGNLVVSLADEMGVCVKDETTNHGSTHIDKYAYQLEETWKRDDAGMRALVREHINHPSVLFWDVGNELIYVGKGEAARMGKHIQYVRSLDPTRLVVTGGSAPLPDPVEVVDYHGYGEWKRLSDRWFMHPELRPAYLRDSGLYWRQPGNEPADQWKPMFSMQGWQASRIKGVFHIEGKPVLFSEGHYYEDECQPELLGSDIWFPLPVPANASDWTRGAASHVLGWEASRRQTVQNVRQAGFPSAMIHVERDGTAGVVLPLAAFSWDRKYRITSGEPLKSHWTVHNDLTLAGSVTATWRLFDGEKLLSQQTFRREMQPSEMADVDLALPGMTVDRDRVLRLAVEVKSSAMPGRFREDLMISVFAPKKPVLPAGQKLVLFDPSGTIAVALQKANASFTSLAKVGEWDATSTVLLAGPESLAGADGAVCKRLAEKITSGGRAIVFAHQKIPPILREPLVQTPGAECGAVKVDPQSPITAGLLNEDFHFWNTRENDQIVFADAPDTPSTGRFRVHVDAFRRAPVLEVGEGNGRVLFCQLALAQALGLDPAADRIFSNLLAWTGAPSPFLNRPAELLTSDERFAALMRSRFGLDAPATKSQQVPDAVRLILMRGTEEAVTKAMAMDPLPMRRWLKNGGTLFVQDLNEAGAAALSQIAETKIEAIPFPLTQARILQRDPLLRGLTHADCQWCDRKWYAVDWRTPAREISENDVGRVAVQGESVRPLLTPAFLAEVPVGQGRIVISTVRAIDHPVAAAARLWSSVAGALGAPLIAGGIKAEDRAVWIFSPLDISGQVNWPTHDEDTGRRGWTFAGSERDLSDLPVGRQIFNGVEWLIPDPAAAKGNGCIGIAATKGKGSLPEELKGIPVRAKAERLWFLHTSAWGIPALTYRIYYTDDRKAWIPGKPDPFIDIRVEPAVHLADWWNVGKVKIGDIYLPGAEPGWISQRTTQNGAENRGRGLYRMSWDNPHPEKEIESIDIIRTGGDGMAMILGITAATREGGTKSGSR